MAFKKEDLESYITEKHIMLDDHINWTNDKLVKILGDYTIEHSPRDKYCWGARYLQSLETVQLCRHLKDEQNAFDKAHVDPMTSPNYVAEFKENGARVFIYYDPAVGFQLFSRRESVSTFLNTNLTSKVLFIENGLITEPSNYIGKFPYRFILDGEITVDSQNCTFEGVQYENIEDLMQAMIGSLSERAKQFQREGNRFIFNIFDCIFFEKNPTGAPPEVKFDYLAPDKDLSKEEIQWVETMFSEYLKEACFKRYSSAKKVYRYLYTLKDAVKGDIRKLPFIRRRQIRKAIVEYLQSKNLPFVEVEGEDTDKLGYLDSVLGNRCEGIILKALHAPYMATLKSSRSHRACIKVKQSVASMLSNQNVDSDFDVFITGINPPKSKSIKDMIGSLNCSIYINDGEKTYEHEIASVSGIPHEIKRKLCAFDEDGKMILNPEYEGKVISINGMALTHKLKFQHAILFEKSDEDLVLKDKNPTDCTWDIEALQQMVITRGNDVSTSKK